MFDSLPLLGILDFLDLLLVAGLLWAALVWLRTARARLALAGLVALGGIYLTARQVGLPLTAWILQGVVAASFLIVVVVFQEDIRRLFEQLALVGVRRRPPPTLGGGIEIVSRAFARLADQRRGALVVIPGRDPLERHLEGGIPLDALVSEPLLLSLFDPNSPGHDGAVILSGKRVVRFAVHLPLSSNHAQLGQRGTRHAAALGLAERVDALCLVVSEERGTVSVAANGRLRTLSNPMQVADEMRRFLAALAPPAAPAARWRQVARHWREGAAALGVAAVLWLMAIPGSGFAEVERSVSVRVRDLPAGYALEEIEPREVVVTLRGRRRDLFFMDPGAVQVRLNATLAELGRRTFTVDPDQVSHPGHIEVLAVTPDVVKLSLRRRGEAPGG